MNGMTRDELAKAMDLAFNLGQTYWQQADRERYLQQNKSKDIRVRYQELKLKTLERLDEA